jgi:hypothetical protein
MVARPSDGRKTQLDDQRLFELVAPEHAEHMSQNGSEVVEQGRERVVDAPELHVRARGLSHELLEFAVVRLDPSAVAVEFDRTVGSSGRSLMKA